MMTRIDESFNSRLTIVNSYSMVRLKWKTGLIKVGMVALTSSSLTKFLLTGVIWRRKHSRTKHAYAFYKIDGI